MSDFLSNVVRRAAGLPVNQGRLTAQAPFDGGLGFRATPEPVPELFSTPDVTPNKSPAAEERVAHSVLRQSSSTPTRSVDARQFVAAPDPSRISPADTFAAVPEVAVSEPAHEPAPLIEVPESPIEASRSAAAMDHRGSFPSVSAVPSRKVAGEQFVPTSPTTKPRSLTAGFRTAIAEPEAQPSATEITITRSSPAASGGDPAEVAAAPPVDSNRKAALVRSAQGTTIRPASTAVKFKQFPAPGKAEVSRQAPPVVHVKIGRIEVRGKTSPAPAPPPPKPVAPLGFARYARQRMYRNWPL
jgi:hypothetical protein